MDDIKRSGCLGSTSPWHTSKGITIMYELFFECFHEKVALTQDEQEVIKSYLTPKKLRKKQYLLQEGDVCKTIAFVEKGTLREYTVDDTGNEHIFQFAIEGWIISD